jgi:hypothetical protein
MDLDDKGCGGVVCGEGSCREGSAGEVKYWSPCVSVDLKLDGFLGGRDWAFAGGIRREGNPARSPHPLFLKD